MSPRAVPVLVRAVTLGAGLGLAFVPVHLQPGWWALTVLGTVAAVVSPARIGALVLSAGFVAAWVTATGWHALPGAGRTALAAALLYLAQQSTALAAVLPPDCDVDPRVLLRWLRRCVLPVAVAAAVIALSALLPRRSGPAPVELAGLGGVLLAVGVATRGLWRRPAGR